MKKTTIYQINSLYRDDFRITGYLFGEGKKSLCVVGSFRGNEIQQIYTCSQLIKTLKQLEKEGKLVPNHQIMVIPSCNPYSMNIQKRFWPTDNTDINRMFPGYDKGETTQRIADGVFQNVCQYQYGIQLASFYMAGQFMPHVRMMTTGNENIELSKHFGLPYAILRNTRPYDTTTLNYNWQLWETEAFSLYTTMTGAIDRNSAFQGVQAILQFLSYTGIIAEKYPLDIHTEIIEDVELLTARAKDAGLLETFVQPGQSVQKGQLLANILNPYDGELKDRILAPENGVVFFLYNEPLIYANTAAFKLIPTRLHLKKQLHQ